MELDYPYLIRMWLIGFATYCLVAIVVITYNVVKSKKIFSKQGKDI